MGYKSLPDMKALATLRAVVELGGVEPAARALHVGQPAVTKRLRNLDTCYGLRLMQRRGQKLTLSPAGERVYEFAKLMLDHHNFLLEDLASLREGQTGLRLEVTLSIAEHMLPELLLQFAERYPDYRIDSRVRYTRRIQERLATGLADLALLEQAPDHPEILVQKWFDDEVVLVCGPGHPLWGEDVIPSTDLPNYHFLLREAASSIRIILDSALKDIDIALPQVMEVGSTDTIVEMLDRGRHVSFLPKFAVNEDLAEGKLHQIRVQGLSVKRTIWIARTRDNLNNPVANAFIELLRESHFG